MAFRWRKSYNLGLGSSFGFLGFRFGVSPDGRKYWSFGIPNTGLYYIKYY
jgi:hypothetical protein